MRPRWCLTLQARDVELGVRIKWGENRREERACGDGQQYTERKGRPAVASESRTDTSNVGQWRGNRRHASSNPPVGPPQPPPDLVARGRSPPSRPSPTPPPGRNDNTAPRAHRPS